MTENFWPPPLMASAIRNNCWLIISWVVLYKECSEQKSLYRWIYTHTPNTVAVRSPKFDKNIDTYKNIKLTASYVNLTADTSFVVVF
jgi:hypothetical protein